MRYREPQPGIVTLPLLNETEAEVVLSELQEHNSWKPATVRGRARPNRRAPDIRSATVSSLEKDSATSQLLEARIRSIVRPLIFKRWQRDILKHTSIQLVRYVPGDFYVAHRDSGTHFNNRYFTVVCYLNSDFKGGGTYFPDSDFTVVPEAGKAVVFPSDYLHRADEILEGVKYIAIVWMLDTPPVEWI